MSLKSAWSWAVLFTAVFAGIAGVLLASATWETPEVPKVQVEALTFNQSGEALYRPEIFTAPIREIQNTWTNLAYVLVGAVIVLRSRFLAGRMVGYGLIFLGFGSGVYHASLMPAWRMIDVVGMYWVMAALLIYALTGARRSSAGVATIAVILALAAAVYRNDVRLAGIKPFDSTYITVGFVAVMLGLLAWHARSGFGRKLALAIAGLTCVAVAGQLGDRVGNFWSRPSGFIQGHSVWHVCGAAALGLLYEFFASRWSDRSLLSAAVDEEMAQTPP